MKFNEKLVLNRYFLSLFECDSFEELTKELKEPRLEKIDENRRNFFFHKLTDRLFDNPKLTKDKLEEYDKNIIRHTESIGRDIKWKYFQYLALLFTEIYLDKYFNERESFLNELNDFLKKFNQTIPEINERIEKFEEKDLNKLAFWMATGSGKTLIMHINLKQFLHYSKGKIKINKILLLTPNEGLSNQHLKEFKESNIEAEIFAKDTGGIFTKQGVEILEITKLAEEEGDKTVAVDSFENNNLVFVDEGHRGSSGYSWKENRDKLSVNGFSFEYSATFGQAINAASGKKRKELSTEYATSIIFDYSYKYFYNDGYGKDYLILNIQDDEVKTKKVYLIASILSFYQQVKIYNDNQDKLKPYLIEKPLMVFVGSSVNAVRTENKKKISDVIDILLFLNEFIKNKASSIKTIDNILKGYSGILSKKEEDIFINRFPYLTNLGIDSSIIFDDIMTSVFNSKGGLLHLDNFKGVDSEIGLKIGEGDYFGVINVGDTNELEKLCIANNLDISKKEFSESLFENINNDTSKINVLIGAKKFTEGWNSWRVSTMGLMNVGKKEGSQIIQLFGRGVRLKGKNFSLKRSRAIDVGLDGKLQPIETLNIFGIRADYMRQFKEYLEQEGVPVNERKEFILPVIKDKTYKKYKLKILKLRKNKNFKKEVKLNLAYEDNERIFNKVIVNKYKQADIIERGIHGSSEISLNETKLFEKHLAFLDIDKIFFELQRFKNEMNWYNLSISKEVIYKLIEKNNWYTLKIPEKMLNIRRFEDIKFFENIFIALLKSYTKAFYEFKKNEWESQLLEYQELDDNDKNLISEYKIYVEETEKDLIEKIQILKNILQKGIVNDVEFKKIARSDFKAIELKPHLYNPLLYKDNKLLSLQISPINLNEGEKDFIEDLKNYIEKNSSYFNDINLYLLRNQSKAGLGFFEADNFHPDFIMWIIKEEFQYITFIDPKGLRQVDIENGAKVNFYKEVKKLEKKLDNKSIILNSFIISVTEFNKLRTIHSSLTKGELEKKNILFQKDDKETYIEKMFGKILS